MDVFAILKSGLISRAALDTEMNTKVRFPTLVTDFDVNGKN